MSNTPLLPADKILKIGNDIDGNIEYVYYWHEESMHAHAAAVSAADNAALREINSALCRKSNLYVIENARLEERIKVLEDALRAVLPWVVTQEVACNGLKCREAVCMSCDSDSEANAQLACDAYAAARAALGDKTPTPPPSPSPRS